MKLKFRSIILCLVLIVYSLSFTSVYAFAKTSRKAMLISYAPKNATANMFAAPNKNNPKTQPVIKQTPASVVKTFEQFNSPARGEEIAVLKTSAGVIKIRLLPQFAPKTVQNFKNRILSGYYDGLSFNRVILNSIIQGGISSQSDSSTAELDEFNPDVRNFRGAVSAVSNGIGKDSGQFIIVEAGFTYIDKDPLNYMISSGETLFPAYVINKYKKVGGTPWLDFHNVVFGQVIQGMNIVDKISQAKVDENNKPVKDIKIQKASLAVY